MLATLRRPRWVALTLLVILLATTMVELGMWQLRRSHERGSANHLVETNSASTPVAPETLLEAGRAVSRAVEWRVITITGEYDAAGQVLIRDQQYDDVIGYDVLTPLRPAVGPALMIDRGWVPSGDTALDAPDVVPPPTGAVTVQARLQASDPPSEQDFAGLPPGQSRAFDISLMTSSLPYATYDAYAEALPGQPGTGVGQDPPRARKLPELSGGPHLAYAIQWFLFTVIAIGGWVVLLRNESQIPDAPRVPGDPARFTAVRS